MLTKIKQLIEKNKLMKGIATVCFFCFSKIVSLIFLVFRIFPINDQKIVACNMKGKRYGDNPMYITDELLHDGFDIVWLLREDVDAEIPEQIRRVKYGFWKNIYELSTAKIWIDSNTKYAGTLKRKKQIFIQTWHGSYGLKKTGSDLGDNLSLIDRVFISHSGKIADIMVSNSRMTTEMFHRSFWFDGEVIEKGSPRNDIFFANCDDVIEKVRKFYNITNQKIVLYAPTFRNNYAVDCFNIDYAKLRQSLSDRFGGEWVVLIRLHPNNIGEAKSFYEYSDNIVNASDYSVMQELLVASDILITDYSSSMFDFATTKKPCFLYATDIEDYNFVRGCYFDIRDLPFPLATNNEEMANVIRTFDDNKYKSDLELLFEKVGLNETGKASKEVAEYIRCHMEKKL